jgi:hypothetical protein
MELSAETIAGLKQKHGDALISATAPSGAVLVFKKPSKEVWAYYQNGLTGDKATQNTCFLRLSMDCVVLPPPQEAAVVFTEFPAMPTVIAKELAKIAGLSDDLDIKKL